MTGPPDPWKQSKRHRRNCGRETVPGIRALLVRIFRIQMAYRQSFAEILQCLLLFLAFSPKPSCHALVVDDQNECKRSGQLEVTLCAAHFNAFFERSGNI